MTELVEEDKIESLQMIGDPAVKSFQIMQLAEDGSSLNVRTLWQKTQRRRVMHLQFGSHPSMGRMA